MAKLKYKKKVKPKPKPTVIGTLIQVFGK